MFQINASSHFDAGHATHNLLTDAQVSNRGNMVNSAQLKKKQPPLIVKERNDALVNYSPHVITLKPLYLAHFLIGMTAKM